MPKKARKGPKAPTIKRKKQISAQTRVKLSQAADKRQRLRGRFAAGLAFSGALHHARESSPPGGAKAQNPPIYKKKVHEGFKAEIQTFAQDKYNERISKGDSPDKAKEVAREMTNLWAEGKFGRRADTDELPFDSPVSSVDVGIAHKRLQEEQLRGGKWKEYKGYAADPKNRQSTVQFLQSVHPEHRAEVIAMLQDPKSTFNKGVGVGQKKEIGSKYVQSTGARAKLNRYSELLQTGYSHDEAMAHLATRRPGRQAGGKVQEGGRVYTTDSKAERVLDERAAYAGRKSRTESGQVRPQDMEVGVRARAVPKKSRIGDLYEDATDQQVIQIQEAARQNIGETFERNQAWTHERKRAALLQKTHTPEGPDRVTFFTTSLGYPSVSVPSDSLVGQYIINKRKRMLKKEGWPRSALKGRFPEAVRDMHVFEASTGLAVGAEGTGGLYQRTGWRSSKRRSPNYGKPVPVGSSILTSSTGAPVYDEHGNVRWTDGATRKFKAYSKRDLGLGVYVG